MKLRYMHIKMMQMQHTTGAENGALTASIDRGTDCHTYSEELKAA